MMQWVEKSLASRPLIWLLAWCAGWVGLSLVTPADATYDILHYHVHNAWSAWHGRLTTDFAPAGMHTYINPVSNMIIYTLIMSLPAVCVVVLLGVVQALVLVPLYLICRRVFLSLGHDSRVSALLLSVAGFCCYSMMNLVSSVRTDHWVSAAVLVAMLALIPKAGGAVTWKRAALAAFLVGLAIGLKLPAIIYAAGLALAVPVAVSGWRQRIQAVLAAAIAGIAGILLTGGWWFWKMWTVMGNPVFPMANNIFHSPYAPPEAFRDERALLRNVWEAVFFPVNGTLRPFNEYEVSSTQDLPIGLLYLAFGIFGFIAVRASLKGSGQVQRRFPRPVVIVLAFLVGTLILWFPLFAIGRYAQAVWMLSPLLFAIALIMVWPAVTDPSRVRLWFGGVCGLCILSGISVPERRAPLDSLWGPYFHVEIPDKVDFENANVIFTGPYPSAFLAAYLPPSANYTFALTAEWSDKAERVLKQMAKERLATQDGPFIAVMVDLGSDEPSVPTLLGQLESAYGLAGDAASCAVFRTSVDTVGGHWVACPLSRVDMPPE